MTDQQKNPEVDKENEAYASDESLFPNNEMKPKESWDFCNTLFCPVNRHCLYSLTFIRSLFNGSVGWWLFVLFGDPYD